MKNINIIAIHYGHNATVCHLRDGEIKTCISEERFNRIKNSTGWPELALKYVKEKIDGEIDYYVMTQRFAYGYDFLEKRQFKPGSYHKLYADTDQSAPWPIKYFPDLYYRRTISRLLSSLSEAENDTAKINEMTAYFAGLLGAEKNKIIHADHHLCHALSTLFFFPPDNKKRLVFTLDGEGDGLCATVNMIEDGKCEVLSKTNRAFSAGLLYKEVTAYLGMKPDEHEFKVMGLAAYAKEKYLEKLAAFFHSLLWLNSRGEFESKIPMTLIKYYLREKLLYYRFDNIAGAVQKFTEEITAEWVKYWIKKTGLRDLGISGGVFMNVKMNQKIAELPEVDSLTIVPSGADESTVFGAAYYGYERSCREHGLSPAIRPIRDYYLGTEYSDKDIENYLRSNGYYDKYKISRPDDMAGIVARLLGDNKVVARFAGKMEFGARALGNRSIMANPAGLDNIRVINEMIKSRDFWMPFATTIMAEDADRYLINPKHVEAGYMAITFDTTPLAHKHLPAALHAYDRTSRPQVVRRETNPEYHAIIKNFKELTGSGGILNTSFNLHGEPNVESPKDAMHTFDDSGLEYLAIGPFLIQK